MSQGACFNKPKDVWATSLPTSADAHAEEERIATMTGPDEFKTAQKIGLSDAERMTSSQPDAQPSFEAQMQRSIDDGKLVHKRELDAALEEIAVLKGDAEPTELPPLPYKDKSGCANCGHSVLQHVGGSGSCIQPMNDCECTAYAQEPLAWTVETMKIVNELTPEITGKGFDPDWFLLRQRFELIERQLIAAQQEIERLTGTLQEERTLRSQTEAEMTALREELATERGLRELAEAERVAYKIAYDNNIEELAYSRGLIHAAEADNTRLRAALTKARCECLFRPVAGKAERETIQCYLCAALQPVEGGK